MALEGPGWTDEAEALRVATSERVRAAIDALQDAGIQARGEVLDGDAAAAARVARSAYSAETILIVATRGSRLDSDEALAAVQAAAGDATSSASWWTPRPPPPRSGRVLMATTEPPVTVGQTVPPPPSRGSQISAGVLSMVSSSAPR